MDPKKQAQQQPPAAGAKPGQPPAATDNVQEQPADAGPQYEPNRPLQWQKKLLAFRKMHVIKMSRVWQSVFYFLGYEREQICERDTNKLDWKKAKELLTPEFFKRIGQYNPFGPKEGDFKAYQRLRFIKHNVSQYEPEQVEDYSMALGKLYRWMLMSIDLREEDVITRRDQIAKLKEERAMAEQASEEREKQKQADLELAQAEYDAKEDERLAALEGEEGEGDDAETEEMKAAKQRQPFNEDSFLKKWDEENPRVDIPPEVKDYIDNDFDVEIDESRN